MFFLSASKLSAGTAMPITLFSDWWDIKNSPKKIEFAGLSFEIPYNWQCQKESLQHEALSCKKPGTLEDTLLLEKNIILSSASLALLKMQRMRLWKKNNIKQDVEQSISSPLGVHSVSRGVYYQNNNILTPVLIRTFDVVVGEKTCVSITVKCAISDCHNLEKEVNHLASSLSKTKSK